MEKYKQDGEWMDERDGRAVDEKMKTKLKLRQGADEKAEKEREISMSGVKMKRQRRAGDREMDSTE